VHGHGWRKAWRINDGYPLQGGTVYAAPDNLLQAGPQRARYPTGTDMDLFIEQIFCVLPEVEKIIGSMGGDWFAFTASPWIYPRGTALSLHQDGHHYSGAFTYFAHSHWNVNWGGYLLVLDPQTRRPSATETPAETHLGWLDETVENRRVWDPGLARCIFPKPNRLVFISPDAEHLLSRVDANAGNHSRLSIAGFFHRPKRDMPLP
jgi:Rps23 Pro-64 3,4-dihydroxylase Tpa1-like proline 4-hydroxylase